MSFSPAYALNIQLEDIPVLIKSLPAVLPGYLKRIKKSSTILLLMGIGPPPSSHFTQVSVPSFQPITPLQFIDANSAWPCYFLKPCVEKLTSAFTDCIIDTTLLALSTHRTCLEATGYCSGTCLIFDGTTLIAHSTDTGFIINHAVITAISAVSRSKRGYLCTGYNAVLFREPCTSCAMALVHGRIKRVFVLCPGKNGPFSALKLNYNNNLNHRYLVYMYSLD